MEGPLGTRCVEEWGILMSCWFIPHRYWGDGIQDLSSAPSSRLQYYEGHHGILSLSQFFCPQPHMFVLLRFIEDAECKLVEAMQPRSPQHSTVLQVLGGCGNYPRYRTADGRGQCNHHAGAYSTVLYGLD
jgi:hypothetical protein